MLCIMGLAFSFESHHSPLPSYSPSGVQLTTYLLWRLLLIKQVRLPFFIAEVFSFPPTQRINLPPLPAAAAGRRPTILFQF
jgi:hypothetical protein